MTTEVLVLTPLLCVCLTGWRRASQPGVHQGQGLVPPEGAGEGGWKPSGELHSPTVDHDHSRAQSCRLRHPSTWLWSGRPGAGERTPPDYDFILNPGIAKIFLQESQLCRLEASHRRRDDDRGLEELFIYLFVSWLCHPLPVFNTGRKVNQPTWWITKYVNRAAASVSTDN